MTQRKESALGKGLDALIKPEISSNENESTEKEVKTKKAPKKRKTKTKDKKSVDTPSKVKSHEKAVEAPETKNSSVDEVLVENVILEVHKNPRISLWSAKSAAVLRLLKKTKPEFSISKEASVLIEDAVKDKYPELWEVFEGKDI